MSHLHPIEVAVLFQSPELKYSRSATSGSPLRPLLLFHIFTQSLSLAMLASSIITPFLALFVAVSASPLHELYTRQDLSAQPVCQDKNTQLVSHDCNAALLALGGGIAGSIEFLRVNVASSTGTSGTCSITTTAVNGGTTIDISKGRLEQAFDAYIAACGDTPGTVTATGGAKPSGDIQITIAQA